jgi:hypothetical protein
LTDHPYRSQPDRAFWSRAVAKGFSPTDAYTGPTPLLMKSDRIMSAGSCFASNLIPFLERDGFTYLRTEEPHPYFRELSENLGYRNFTAAYGNIYTARQFVQLIDRAYGRFVPAEDRWHVDGAVVDPFRPGLRYPARSDAEYDVLTAQHLAAVREGLENATVLVFTLGLTEAWRSPLDGAVYPACPGTVAGTFDPARHEFHNFSASEVTDDLHATCDRLHEVNPGLRIILTVSPVPLVATATDAHVVVATTRSKSILRVAAGEVADARANVAYFPAYEIVTGPQAPHDFFEPDRRDVSSSAVEAVMDALMSLSESSPRAVEPASREEILVEDVVEDGAPVSTDTPALMEPSLAQLVADAECDEMLADSGG